MHRWTRARLRERVTGEVLVPGNPGYEEARRIHNGLIDRRPAIITRCRQTADVVEAVDLGRTAGMAISVRGGGHSVAGRAVTDGGLMVDLSPMRGIHVDPRAGRARAQGDVTWGQYDRATHLHGLARRCRELIAAGHGAQHAASNLGCSACNRRPSMRAFPTTR